MRRTQNRNTHTGFWTLSVDHGNQARKSAEETVTVAKAADTKPNEQLEDMFCMGWKGLIYLNKD